MAYPKITKRTDGRYSAKVTIGTNLETGKLVRKEVYGKTKNEVKSKIDRLEEEKHKGILVPSVKANYTLRDWCDDWYEIYAKDYSLNSQRKYKGLIKNYIVPSLGHVQLSKLTTMQCQQFINHLKHETGLHNNTLNQLITFFKTLLNKAVILGHIGKNPAQYLEVPKRVKPKLNHLSEDETFIFLARCGSETLDNLCKLAVYTGMRESELMALTWDNLVGNKLIVDHQFGRLKTDETFYKPKNKKARVIGLSKSALKVLEDQRRYQTELRLKTGKEFRNDLDLVFTDVKGKRLVPNSIYRHFKKICSKIGLEGIRFHDLRHTYAVLNIRAGVDFKTISQSLGHHSVAFTMDQYAYVTENMLDESASKLEKYLSNYS